MTKIKICGLFRNEDIEFVNLAKPDYVGFVFAENSRRFVTREFAAELSKKLDPDIVPVGVFVGADIGGIADLFEKKVIRAAQLHGGESDEYIAELKKRCKDLTVIRAVNADNISYGNAENIFKNINCIIDKTKEKTAFENAKIGRGSADFADTISDGIKEKTIFENTKIGRGAADFLLIDNGKGGTGKVFDWKKIRSIEPPFFLAGGIDEDNIFDALNLSPYAVDISGGAETDGVKDGEKIIFLCQAARKNNGL
jgi:phosphoribosylanthranilate isomerase